MSAAQFSDVIKTRLMSLATDASIRVSPKPSRVVLLAPGEAIAWDDCCDGQVWSRLVSVTPLPSSDPTRRPGMHPCSIPTLVVTFELGIIRCAATVNEFGDAPSPAQISRDGVQSIDDMADLFQVLRCADFLRSFSEWTPQGPEGGCHGGFWTGTFTVNNCFECDTE